MHKLSWFRLLAAAAIATLLATGLGARVAAQPVAADAGPAGPVTVPGLPFAVPLPPDAPAFRDRTAAAPSPDDAAAREGRAEGRAEGAGPANTALAALGWQPPRPPRRPDASPATTGRSARPSAQPDEADEAEGTSPAAPSPPEIAAVPSDARPFTPPRPPRRGEPAGLAPPDSAGEAVPAAPEVAAVPPVAREAPEAAPEDGRPFTPPLPPHRPGPEEAGPLPEVSAQAEPSEAPLPPLIATPGTPADPGWTLRNRPDGAVEPEPGGGAAPDAPEPDIGDVAMVDRPAVVEDRPMAPPQPDQDGEDAGIETAARADGAAAGPAAEPWEGEQARVLFDGAETEFGPGVRDMLDRIAARLQRDAGLRLTVLSYAGGEPEAAGRARLLSLTRALAVRDYLTDRNIRQARISVRGLGDSAEQGPTDRIDLLLVP